MTDDEASTVPLRGVPVGQPNPDVLVGRNVRRAREKAGLTQKEVSDRLRLLGWDIDPTAVTRIEKGGRAVRVNQLYLLAEVLSTAPGRLMQDGVGELTEHYEKCLDLLGRFSAGVRLMAGSMEILHHTLVRAGDQGVAVGAEIPVNSPEELFPHLLEVVQRKASDRVPLQVLDRDLDKARERASQMDQIFAALIQNAVSTERSEAMSRGEKWGPADGVDQEAP